MSRVVLHLKGGAVMTHDEIGEALGISRQAVYQHEQNGLRKLRKKLARVGIDCGSLHSDLTP